MKRLALLCLPLAFGLASVSPVAGDSPAVAVTADGLKDLVAEYEQAYLVWKDRYDQVQGRDKAELRKQHPVPAFWERFEALGQAGEGRAYLWMISSVKSLGLKRDARGPVVQDLYAKLLAGSTKEAWFVDVVRGVARDLRYLGVEEAARWLTVAEGQVPSVMVKTLIQIRRAEILSGSEDPEVKAQGQRALATYEAANTLPGASAYDFAASTIDGHDFKLSDYRGKVVLVDFYGFW